ncbi:MAG: hypothetical protein LKG27_05460 [Clostridiaceae bacterium]|jgi:hypothetical protein|nr:hypothetical protein [Clostridiaceae bacterium]
MKKTGLLIVAGAFLVTGLAANAVDVTAFPSAGGSMYQDIYNSAGANYSHDMQMLNQQRRAFEGSVDYKTQKKREQADQQVKDTFQQIKSGTDATKGMEFTQGEDGSIIIKQVQQQ